jgi:hypothetical protein
MIWTWEPPHWHQGSSQLPRGVGPSSQAQVREIASAVCVCVCARLHVLCIVSMFK